MELLKFNIAANETKVFEKAGRYLEIIDSTGEVTIDLYDRNGGNTDDATGALSGLYLEGEFSAITVKSATAQTITLLITDGRGGSRRQPGNVRVIDQSADKTLAGNQFWGIVNRGATAGAVSLAGIRNTGSKSVYIKRMTVLSSTAGGINIWSCTGAPTVSPANNAGAGVNKSIGQAASTAGAMRGDAAAGVPTAGELPGVSGVGAVMLAAGVTVEILLTTPIRLAPGFGICVSGGVVNRDISTVYDFEEI